MITLILILLVIAFIFSLKYYEKLKSASLLFFSIILFFAIISFFFTCVSEINYICNNNNVTKTIENYENQAAEIENNMKAIVNNYIVQNPDTEFNFSQDESTSNSVYVTIVGTIPELNSIETIQNSIKKYNEIQNELKDLNKKASELSSNKWLLYFGK